jgi:hypothetical protein
MEQQEVENNQVPHVGVFTISYVIYKQLPDGNFHPNTVDKANIQLSFDCDTAEEAKEQADILIEELQKTWKEKHPTQLKLKQKIST